MVNGAISSVERVPDVWVLNSRQYDDRLYTNPKLWPEERKLLHESMMAQGVGRSARHILFVLKSHTPDQTIARLKQQGCKWRGQTVMTSNNKIEVVRKAGVHKFTTAFNISAGLTAVCLALVCGAKHVNLCGFSFSDGYHYLPDAKGSRFHISQDQEAISDLLKKHPDSLTINRLT